MAKVTVVKHKCDRCGVLSDTEFPKEYPRYIVTVIAVHEYSSDRIEWEDLCGTCQLVARNVYEIARKVKQ